MTGVTPWEWPEAGYKGPSAAAHRGCPEGQNRIQPAREVHRLGLPPAVSIAVAWPVFFTAWISNPEAEREARQGSPASRVASSRLEEGSNQQDGIEGTGEDRAGSAEHARRPNPKKKCSKPQLACRQRVGAGCRMTGPGGFPRSKQELKLKKIEKKQELKQKQKSKEAGRRAGRSAAQGVSRRSPARSRSASGAKLHCHPPH
jgi:hypothetical protein